MLEVRIDPALEERLAAIAAKTGDSPELLAQKALLAYLEDLEDYATAVEAMKEFDRTKTVSLDELMARYGVED